MPSQTIRIGLECNEGCLYCFADPELWKDRPRGWGEDYSNLIGEDWRRELREIREAGYDGLSISGGEPTLYADLLKMVKYARLLGFERVELQTNGTLISARNAQKLARAGVCSALVSLPSHVEKIYDAITCTKGYYEAAVAGIGHLIDAGVRVTLCHVLCTANYREVPAYAEFVAERFVDGRRRLQAVSVLYVQPEGRATQKPGLYPSLSDLRPYWIEAMARFDARGVPFRTDPQTGLPFCMMPGHEDHVDLGLLLDPESFWGDDVSSFEYMQGHKRLGERCEACFFVGACYGFWNEYLEAYGHEGLEPVARTAELEARFPAIASGRSVPRLAPGQVVPVSRMERKVRRRVHKAKAAP